MWRLELAWSIVLWKSFKKSSCGGWSRFKATSLLILWEKLVWRLELVWTSFLHKSFEKSSFGGWSWFEAFSFTNPLRKAHLEAGIGLKHFPLLILWEKLVWRAEVIGRLELVLPSDSLFAGSSWFGARSFINPKGKACLEAGPGLKHFPLQILYKKLIWRLELVWGIFRYKSFKESLFGGWSWFEALSFTNPLRRCRWEAGACWRHFPWVESGAGLKHFPLQII